MRGQLGEAGVDVRLQTRVDQEGLRDFDHVVLATYASLNDLYPKLVRRPTYRFEVCEKPMVRLPDQYLGHSLVVMDGPFFSLDPVVGSDRFLLGNVDHAIHATTVGAYPVVPHDLAHHVNRGLVVDPPQTRLPQFVASARQFLTDFDRLRHLGTYFTIRAVLPNVEATDERPTLVRRVDERTSAVFAGKITTCVDAARELVSLLTTSPVRLAT